MRVSEYTTQTLPSHQQKYLRGLAHRLKPVLRIMEISDNILSQVNLAFKKEEIIKIRLDHPQDKELLAVELAEKSKSYLCGLIGHTVILYHPFPQNPVIQLPKR